MRIHPQTEFNLPAFNYRRVLVVLIFSFFIVLLLLLHSKFPIFMDEAIYSDITNRFIQGLGMSTALYEDFIPHIEQYSYWYPPMYFLVLAPIYIIFGAAITTARLFSLITAIGVLALITLSAKKILKSKTAVLALLIVLMSDFYFQDGSIVARMEMLTILFGTGALYFHLLFLERKKMQDVVLSGVFSAASLLTHPTAAVIVIPISLNLLLAEADNWKERLNMWFAYVLPIIIGLGLWIASFWPQRNIFFLQNQVQLQRKSFGSYYVIYTLKHRPLHRIVLITYYLSNTFFVLKTIITKKWQNSLNRLLVFLAFSSVFMPILMKEMWYLVFTTFIGAVILTINLQFWWKNKKALLALLVFSTLIMLNSIIFFENISAIISEPNDYFSVSKIISDHLPYNAKLMTASYPDPFFYLEKERPDIKIRIGPNSPELEPINPEVYNKIFSDVDFILFSYFANSQIYEYVRINTEEVILDNSVLGNRFSIFLIKLKPLEERVLF